ncbi:hypothetical protein [Bacillus cereus group sp. RP43]|uniref:hypothetical protein n=1 Tax=Bacillus cereus group sp. RP43 TaxID=3040260 RepID=UPI003399E655
MTTAGILLTSLQPTLAEEQQKTDELMDVEEKQENKGEQMEPSKYEGSVRGEDSFLIQESMPKEKTN